MFVSEPAWAASPRTTNGFDYLHVRLWMGPEYVAAGQELHLQVSRPDRYGSASFFGTRAGVGGQVFVGLGFKVEPRLSVGAALTLSKAYAPLRHHYLDEIGAEFDPVLTRKFLGLFADAYPSGRTLGLRVPLHAGGMLGYSWLDEKLVVPSRRTLRDGSYEVSLFMGYREAWADELYLDISVRGTLIGVNPLGLFQVSNQPFFGSFVRSASAGLFAGFEFR